MATNTKRVMTSEESEERKKKREEVLARGKQRAQEKAEWAKTATTQQKQQAVSATAKKAQNAYSNETYQKVVGENRAQQEAVRQATAGKDSPSQYKRAYELQRFDGNYSQFKDDRSVFAYAKNLQNDAQRDRFLNGYARYMGVKNPDMDKIRAAANAAFGGGIYDSYSRERIRLNDALGVLYDADGRHIDINTASYAKVVHGIRLIADEGKRKEAAENLEKLTKKKGSRFYGQAYDKALTTSYLGNPEFNEAKYKEVVSGFADAFYPQSGKDEYNEEQYRSIYESILGKQYGKNEERQILSALDAAYRNTTGKNAPDMRTPKADQAKQDAPSEDGREEKQDNGFLNAVKDGALDAAGALGFGPNAVAPNKPAAYRDEEDGAESENAKDKKEYSALDYLSGEAFMDPEWVEEYNKRDETPKISQEPGYTGTYASATVSDVPHGNTGKKYMDVRDDADVYRAFMEGRIDEVNPEDAKGFLSLIENQYAKQLLGTVADPYKAQAALNGNEGAEMVTMNNLTSMGTTFWDAYTTIQGETFPDELRSDGMLVLLDLTRRAAEMEENGTLGGDENLPAMERLLTTDEYAKAQISGLYRTRDVLIADKNQRLTEQQEQTEQSISDARKAFMNQTASAEQMQLLYDSVPDDALKRAKKDKTYKSLIEEVRWKDYGYFYEAEPGSGDEPGGFYRTALYESLPKDTDLWDYKSMLGGYMQNIIELDACVAASLGMSLEEFYAGMGGMSLDTIANRASAEMVAQAKGVTEEDARAMDAVQSRDGIGWAATGGLSVSQGVLNTYTAYADTLYVGVTEGNVIRTGEKMKIRYEQEYGTINGRAAYRDELQDYIDSGLLDESYAKSLQHALDNVTDVYSIGIDPADAKGVIVKTGAWARRNAQMQRDYVAEKGTEAEMEAFNVISGTVQNGLQMAVSYGASQFVGGALVGAVGDAYTKYKKTKKIVDKIAKEIGFAVGYDAGQWSQNVFARMDEGYGRETAVALGSVDTLGNHIANSVTFDHILTRATGVNDLANSVLNAMFRNPIGSMKGMAAVKAFVSGLVTGAENVTEEIGDTFREGIVQNGIINKWIAPLYRRADSGEDVRATDVISALLSAAKPANIAGAAMESAKETLQSAPEIAIQTSLFAVAGAAGNTYNTYRGFRTAQNMPFVKNGITEYDSVRRASDIVAGRDNDVQGFIDAFARDLDDDRFVRLFNEAAETTGMANRTIRNMLRASGNEDKVKQIEQKQEQIASHEEKAAANKAAMDAAADAMAKAQERIDNGTGSDHDVQVVIDSAEAIAKNRNGYDESTREAEQKKDEAKALQDEVMQEARAKARRQQQDEQKRARAAMLDNRDAALADVNAQIEAVNAEIEDALASFDDAMQMELDIDTLGALGERIAELEKRKEKLLGETDDAETDAGTENGTQAQTDPQDTEEEQKAIEAENQRVMAQQEADDMKPVYSTLASTRVYVDDSQRANILARTGLKTLGQVSRKYGLRLTIDKGKATVSLDGSFFKDIAQMSGGRIDGNAAHPEEALIDLVERKKQLKGMQASVGETAYERYLPDGTFYAMQDPVMQQTASDIYKRTGIEVVVAPLANNVRALYDRVNGRIVMSNRIGAGEGMRKAVMHELTHFIEGSAGYDAYRKAVIGAAYKNDPDGNLRAEDEARIQETYANAGIELAEDGVEKELVADATEKIINDPDGRIVQEILDSGNIGVLMRVKMKLSQFLARHRAKKNGTVDAYDAMRNAHKKLGEAIKAAGKWAAEKAGEQSDPTVSLDTAGRKRGEMAYGAEGEQVQYAIVQDESGWPMAKADRELSISENPREWNDEIQTQIQNTIRKNGDVEIKTLDGEKVLITKDSQWHAGSWPKDFSQDKYRVKINASAHLDDVSAVSYDQNPGKSNKPDDGRHTDIAQNGWRYRTAVYEDYDGKRYKLDFSVGDDGNVKTVYNIGKVSDVYTQKEKSPNSVAGSGVGASSLGTTPAIKADMSSGNGISIADSQTDVNTQYMQDGTQYALAPNQFANETIQRLSTFSEETKAVLAGRTHEVVPNAERMDAAWQAVRERGRNTMMDELLDKPIGEWTPQDHVNAALCSVLAEDAGDLNASVKMAMKYDEAGTNVGHALQVRKMIKQMTPSGTVAETIRAANSRNEAKGIPANSFPSGSEQMKMPIDTTDENGTTKRTPEKVMEVYREADTLMNQIRELPTDVSYDNPWGLPLTEGKMALIRAYKLEGVSLPGTGYNTATTKQRMLAAILAADDADLHTVSQQLAAMKRGYSVVTEADERYIASQMSEFKAIEGANATEAMTQAGKNALGRAWQAQDNVNIAGFMTKWGNIRYDNMLSAPATWTRNVMSNVINHGLERTATRIAAGIDKAVEKKTGTRTTDVATREERKAGNEAFGREIAQTVTDYFVTHTDTGHGRKYGPGHTGRVFQNEFLETYRNIVDFAMQIGDRPFYERCYTEELAIIRRLGVKTTEMVDGAKVARTMTEEEMKAEATVRATQRVFQEDRLIVDAINDLRKKNPTYDLVLSTIVPFVKTPTNVAMRAIDYSPVGLAITAARRGLGGIDTGKSFSISQRDYVMNMGRGMTGTGLYMIGWALAASGLIRSGREEEENQARRDVRATLMEPYGIYLSIGDSLHEIDWALPMSASLAAGAEFYWMLEDGSGIGSALFSSVFSGVGDQILSTPMLSSMRDIFKGYSDTEDMVTRFLSTGAQSLLNQTLSPSFLRAVAKYTDPYVRDTSDSNPVWAALKKNVVQYWPVVRGLLPVETDLTGDKKMQSGYYGWGKEHENAALHFLDSFFTPTATIGMKNDEALFELLDLSYRENNTGCLPKALIEKNDYQLDVTSGYAYTLGFRDGKKGVPYSIPLTDDEKRMANQEFASLLFNGSGTARYTNADGEFDTVTGLREIMNSFEWKNANDAERVNMVQEKAKEIKLLMMKKLTDQKKKDGEL